MVVLLTDDGRVALIGPPGAAAVLELLAVGRLRGALRDAVYALDDPTTTRFHLYEIAAVGTGS